MDRDQIIALAVAMGTPKETAEANFDAAYPPAPQPGPDDVVGNVRLHKPDGTVIETVVYGDGSAEETVLP